MAVLMLGDLYWNSILHFTLTSNLHTGLRSRGLLHNIPFPTLRLAGQLRLVTLAILAPADYSKRKDRAFMIRKTGQSTTRPSFFTAAAVTLT